MRTRVTRKLVFFGLSVALTLALVSTTLAQPGEFVKGVLQPLADGFPKRNINIVVVDDPGTPNDLYAKSFQAALKDISPVPILISNEPSAVGGTFYTIQDVARREGGADGYYPIVYSSFGNTTDLLVEPGTREIGAKLEQVSMVISTDILPYILIQRKNAPWGPTFAGMVKYGKENPGKLRYVSYEVGSANDITCEYTLHTLGLKVKKYPQGTRQECASTVGAGEGDFTMVGLAEAIPNSQAGRVDVTLVMGDTVPSIWKDNPNVVTAKQAGLNPAIQGSLYGLAVPWLVPKEHVDWLFKLFKAASESPIHRKRATVLPGILFRTADPATANAENKKILEDCDPIIRAIGLHIDDIKKK
jgi:tripartite-type tricarboxylate transporter receptor subunit TctC